MGAGKGIESESVVAAGLSVSGQNVGAFTITIGTGDS
jgi:hypothetical protein